MTTKRLLVVEKLVVAIPDDANVGDELTIDDALMYLLQFRSTAGAKLQNQLGDFTHCIITLPDSCNPEDPMALTKEALLNYLDERPDITVAGMAATVRYDEELKAYRNCYSGKDLEVFNARKGVYLERLAKDHISADDLTPVSDNNSTEIMKGGTGIYQKPDAVILGGETDAEV